MSGVAKKKVAVKKKFNPNKRKTLRSDIEPDMEELEKAIDILVLIYHSSDLSSSSFKLSDDVSEELRYALIVIGDCLVRRYPEFAEKLIQLYRKVDLIDVDIGRAKRLARYLKD